MSFADIRAEIVTILKTVDGIGQVHDYIRHTTFWNEYFRDHTKNMQVNTWEVSRRNTGEAVSAVENQVSVEPFYNDVHQVIILGRMSLNDDKASEKQFQTLISAIVEKFRQDPNNLLNGKVFLPRQIQVPIIEPRTYGGVLCHFCEMTYEAIERVGGSC